MVSKLALKVLDWVVDIILPSPIFDLDLKLDNLGLDANWQPVLKVKIKLIPNPGNNRELECQ